MPLPGSVGWIVCGPDQTRLLADVIDGFFFIEYVIAGSHHIDAGGEELFAQRRGDGKTTREVLSIHNGEVDVVLFAQILNALQHSQAAWLRDHIANH